MSLKSTKAAIVSVRVLIKADEVLYPPKYLNSLKFSGMPNHEINVKVGAPIMLLRNLNAKNAKKGLCNGTRLIITRDVTRF